MLRVTEKRTSVKTILIVGSISSLITVFLSLPINNVPYFQPGCFKIGDVGACSHSKSHEYYMASITKAICFASRYVLCMVLAKGHTGQNICEILLTHPPTKGAERQQTWPFSRPINAVLC